MKKDRKSKPGNMNNTIKRKPTSIFTNQKQIDRAIQAAVDQYNKWKKNAI
jgi:hypothetical protein